MHDTTSYELNGESAIYDKTAEEWSVHYGYDLYEITTGLMPAVNKFLEDNKDSWVLEHRYTHNNGLCILKKIN